MLYSILNDVLSLHVLQYRLAAHLSSAVVLYSFLAWNAKSVLRPSQEFSPVAPRSALQRFRRLVLASKVHQAQTHLRYRYVFPAIQGVSN